MPAAQSLYRRHRPRSFADVVGQEHVVRTLRNAVEQGKVHHAYLFVGSRGTGKTSMAKILAACLNCENGPTTEPCGVCESCVAIARATSLDVIEMDAASNNSVDDIRDLRERVAFAPISGKHKVYILDEAHMLTAQAWNAFLKTLEEPPPNTIFVLATTEAQKVLPTVVDRCHRFDFGRPTVEQLTAVLRRVAETEGFEVADDGLAIMARGATGSFRDALGTLEQLVTYSGPQVATADVLAVLGVADADLLFGTLDAIAAHDPGAALRTASQLAASGRDVGRFFGDLEAHARALMVVAVCGGTVPAELRLTADLDARLAAQAGAVATIDVVRLLDLLAAGMAAMRDGADARTQLELALLKAAAPDVDPSLKALAARVERLERGGPVKAVAAPAVARAPAAPEPDGPVARVATAAVEVVRSGAAAATAAVAEVVEVVRPAAAPDPMHADAELDLDTVIAMWPAVLAALGDAGNRMLAAALESARPVVLGAGELTIGFAAEAAFLKKKAEEASNRTAVAEALRSVTGTAPQLAYVLREDVGVAEDAPVDASLGEEELLRRFMAEFDAEELPADEREDEE